MYWRPGCVYCASLRRRLRRTGLTYQEIDIWDDLKAASYVRSVNHGNETVPTVTVAGHPLTNPSAGQVLKLVQQEAAHLLPAPGTGERSRFWWPWRGGPMSG